MTSSRQQSERRPASVAEDQAYVWVWLPGAAEPVVCGQIADRGEYHEFVYGASYRARSDAMALDHIELPLTPGIHRSRHHIQGVIRDAAPDAWGRRVLIHRLGMDFAAADKELREIDYLVNARGERVGALHVQRSPYTYEAPTTPEASLADLLHAAELLERDEPLPPDLEAALQHGTSIGGARPKALVSDGGKRWLVAKFSSTTDTWPVVRCEYLGMRLADRVGIDVANVELKVVDGKDVLLVERFDRKALQQAYTRRHFFSALTALSLAEHQGRYASYPEFADFLAKHSDSPSKDCRELYRRMVFNMVIGNTDDHARNHAVFWDGASCQLTPAYDVGVIQRVGQTGSQAMIVGTRGYSATLSNATSQSERFLIDEREAHLINEEICAKVHEHWRDLASESGLGDELIKRLNGTAILSPLLFED